MLELARLHLILVPFCFQNKKGLKDLWDSGFMECCYAALEADLETK